ncbi:MAG: phenylalanine--tRNA ligase subunit beta, partial [Bacteroidetes bacterium]|nr:phenylalanine--tRNA ligase subunit beta [Bacteroidota bacterium]
WDTRARSTDIFDLKGLAENVLEAIRLPEVRFEPVKARSGLVDQQIAILSAGERVGVLGRLATAVAESGDLRAPLYFLELDWSTVCDLAAPHVRRTYEPFSRHPVVERDIAVLVDRSTPVGPMMDVIRSAGGLLLSSIKVFDLYEGERIDANSKSVAFALTFGADRTLRDAEVDKRVATIVEALEKEYDAQLRE